MVDEWRAADQGFRTGTGPVSTVQYRRDRSTHSFNDPSSEAGKEA